MTILAAHLEADGRLTGEASVVLPYWSFSKTIIAALCVDADTRGELDLDTPCPGRHWTLRDLLQHRAGVGNYGGLPAYHAAVAARGTPWTRDDFLRAVPLEEAAPPRARFAYSNIGYMLAREALEQATGQPLADLLRRLTDPLGLTSMRLARTPADFADMPFPADGYHPGWVAHGCLMGTPADAVRLLAGVLDRFPQMDRPIRLGSGVPGRIWTEHGYGLGLMSGRAGTTGRAVGHSGAGPFSACAVYAFPDLPGRPVTAAFVPGGDEAPAERAARDRAVGA